MAYNPRDFYFKQAKAKSFAARSVFKLEEIDERFRVLKKGDKVLDLGAAPGSWSQYCSQKTGPAGRVFGLDLKEIKLTVAGVPTSTTAIEYELTYSTKDQPSEGVFSTAKPKDGQSAFASTFERTITLGTCSRNVCRYHAITSPIKVTLKFEGGYGAQIAQKDFELSSIE
jgi:predicted methyltransferase